MATRDERRATLAIAAAKAAIAEVEGRRHVEYHIAGLEQELRDGLARLERADQANNHVALYQRYFDREVENLRRELDSPTPDIHEIAVSAMQAAWLARIWPVLQSARLQWRGADNLASTNTTKRSTAVTKRDRCLVIARTLTNQTPAAVRRRYKQDFPGEPAPSDSAVRRYLQPTKK